MAGCSSCGTGDPPSLRKLRQQSMLPDGPDGFFYAEAYPDCDPYDRYVDPEGESPLMLILVGRATDFERWFLPQDYDTASAWAKEHRLRVMSVLAQYVCRQLVEDLLAAAAGTAPG
jgi:hypothetical protein